MDSDRGMVLASCRRTAQGTQNIVKFGVLGI
jgi:hypothetical protein